jgi:hypothetical protein
MAAKRVAKSPKTAKPTIAECPAYDVCRAQCASCDICQGLDVPAWKDHVIGVLARRKGA